MADKIGRTFYALFPVIICIVWVLISGKDVNWDSMNYHYFAGKSALNHELSNHLFPAGPQSYLNPYAYVPFYVLVNFFENPIMVGICLAILHSLTIYAFLFFCRHFFYESGSDLIIFASLLLGLSTPIFWHQIGSSFIDIYICGLILCGLCYLLRSIKSNKFKDLFLSASLLGIAVGFKLTAAIYAFSAGVLAFVFFVLINRNIKYFIFFGVVGIIFFLLIEGYWGGLVWKEFGNPFLPYFNNIFKSEYYFPLSITNTRFIPSSFEDVILFPLKLMLPTPWHYYEIRSPDIRLIVFLLLVMINVKKNIKMLKLNSSYLAVYIFFIISFCLWMLTSTNGRYGLPLLLLLGVLTTHQLFILLNKRRFYFYFSLILLIQSTISYMSSELRWDEREWGTDYFDLSPKGIEKYPAVYVSTDKQSYSFFSKYLDKSSSFVNLSGQLPLSTNKSISTFDELVSKHHGRIKLITRLLLDEPEKISETIGFFQANAGLVRFGYEVNSEKCLYFPLKVPQDQPKDRFYLICDLKKNETIKNVFYENKGEADFVFDEVELFCSGQFNPKTAVSEKTVYGWRRYYVGSERELIFENDQVVLYSSKRVKSLHLGSYENWRLSAKASSEACKNKWLKIDEEFLLDTLW